MFGLPTRIAGARSQREPRLLESVLALSAMERTIRRECARADRHGGELSLVLFRIGGGARRRRLTSCRLARIMLRRARETDEVGWFGKHFIAALLPDTPARGAAAFADGVCRLAAGRIARPSVLIFTYPKNWVTSLGVNPGHPFAITEPEALRTRLNRLEENVVIDRPTNGAGRANGYPLPAQADVHANGNRYSHGNGHSSSLAGIHVNGHANGNGHPHGVRLANGNGQPNGNGLAKSNGHAAAPVATLVRPDAQAEARTSVAPAAAGLAAQPGLSVEALEELLVLPLPRWKRACDIVGAFCLTTVFLPLMAIVALAIKLTSAGPILFTQRRAGLGGRPFIIYKFRTMITDAEQRKSGLRPLSEQDGPAFKLARDPRITRLGQVLRKTSIDELPQLWNVLLGDMSLVGPRPLPLDESDACEPWQRRRLQVTPGLTCIWQVEGRSRVTFAEWVRMDVRYIRRRTLWHDAVILLRTVPAVLLRKGAR
jgi:lipopolysaccharide/colanic/teichoic acid biosynthesis glycosyltransferase